MRLFALSLFGTLACSTAAIACPELNLAQGATTLDLASPQSVSLTAGGDNRLDQCELGMLGYGQFRSAPDYSFVVGDPAAEDVVLAVTSECDAAMLVNTADGAWHFNDDANGNLDPRLVVPAGAALDGQVDVWLGTFAGGECAATLNIAQSGAELPVAPPTVSAPLPGSEALTLVTPPPAMPAPAPVVPAPAPEAQVQTQTPPPAPVPAPMPAPAPIPVPAPQAVPAPVPAPIPVPPPVPAAICPNPSIIGPSLTLAGAQLLSPQAYVAQVGGQHDISGCAGIDGWGSANEAPSFTLFLSQMDGYLFSAETASDCDPTLILRDAYGQWFFNDDGPNGLQPLLEVDGGSLNGRVDIWVGGFGGSSCQGTITFRTVSPRPAGHPCPDHRLGALQPDRLCAGRGRHDRPLDLQPAGVGLGLVLGAADLQLLPLGDAGVWAARDRGRICLRYRDAGPDAERLVVFRRRLERQPEPADQPDGHLRAEWPDGCLGRVLQWQFLQRDDRAGDLVQLIG